MRVRIQQGKLEKFAGDLLVLKWVQGQKMPARPVGGDGSTGAVDKALSGLISKMIKEEGFKGKEGETLVFPILHGKIAAKKVMVLGLGEQKNVTPELIRKSSARIVKEARRQKSKRVGTIFIGTGTAGIDPFTAAKAMTEGALLGSYAYSKYKSAEARKDVAFPSELTIVTAGVHEVSPSPVLRTSSPEGVEDGPSERRPRGGQGEGLRGGEKLKITEAQRGIREGEIYAHATIFARELVNEPASNMVPKTLADVARSLAYPSPGLRPSSPSGRGEGEGVSVKILNRAECEKLGMGAYLGVAKGSDHEPYFIHLVYKPPHLASGHPLPAVLQGEGRVRVKKIAIVGKGITFDSCGLSLKPAQHIETMKLDMAGCAAVLGIFSALPKLKPNVEVHGISAVCENMPSGRAMKPGDIVRTISGKTIEVLNTDAEGRLTLADAFGYVNKFVKPDAMIDMATLTGACMVALGEEVAGYMGNDRALLDNVKKASEASGERAWELPLIEEYREQTKSHVADFSNITPSRYAGAITAGLFLEAFAEKMPWVHMDIAGPAWAEKEVIPYMPRGGTGFGVRTMLELLKSF